MRSIPVVDDDAVAMARDYDRIADFLLLDSHRTGDLQIGALGVTMTGRSAGESSKRCRYPAFWRRLGRTMWRGDHSRSPFGIDSKTKTDLPDGSGKDIDAVRRFVAAATTRAADYGARSKASRSTKAPLSAIGDTANNQSRSRFRRNPACHAGRVAFTQLGGAADRHPSGAGDNENRADDVKQSDPEMRAPPSAAIVVSRQRYRPRSALQRPPSSSKPSALR